MRGIPLPLTCHIDDPFILQGTGGEPGIRRPARHLGAVILSHHLQCQDARRNVAILAGCAGGDVTVSYRLPIQQPHNFRGRIRAPGVAPQRH